MNGKMIDQPVQVEIEAPQPSTRSLLTGLAGDMGRLIRQELELFSLELKSKAVRAGTQMAVVAGGGILAIMGVFLLLCTLTAALVYAGMPVWGALLLVALAVCGLAAALVVIGINHLKEMDLKPRQTVETLRQSAAYIKQRITH